MNLNEKKAKVYDLGEKMDKLKAEFGEKFKALNKEYEQDKIKPLYDEAIKLKEEIKKEEK